MRRWGCLWGKGLRPGGGASRSLPPSLPTRLMHHSAPSWCPSPCPVHLLGHRRDSPFRTPQLRAASQTGTAALPPPAASQRTASPRLPARWTARLWRKPEGGEREKPGQRPCLFWEPPPGHSSPSAAALASGSSHASPSSAPPAQDGATTSCLLISGRLRRSRRPLAAPSLVAQASHTLGNWTPSVPLPRVTQPKRLCLVG